MAEPDDAKSEEPTELSDSGVNELSVGSPVQSVSKPQLETVQSISSPGFMMTTPDLDNEDDEPGGAGAKETWGSKVSAFFSHSLGIEFILAGLLCLICGAVGGIGLHLNPKGVLVYQQLSLWLVLVEAAVFISSYIVFSILVYGFIRMAGLFNTATNQWNWLHYGSESQGYISGCLWALAWIVAVGTHILSPVFFFGSPLGAEMVVKMLFALFLALTCLGIKSHLTRSLAMSFNYANYRDRIEAALHADRIFTLLTRSRHTYKFRKKWYRPGQQGSVQRTNQINALTRRWRRTSADAITNVNASASPVVSLSSTNKTGDVVVIDATPKPTTPEPKAVKKPSKILSEAEKQANFIEFSKLAARTLGSISLGQDYKVETFREARKRAAKLWKYMRTDRAYLEANDLRVYIENEEDVVAVIELLRKSVRGPPSTAPLAEFSFGEKALRRSIHTFLNEVLMIVKSMQTVETALNKIDWLLSATILFIIGVGASVLFGNAIQFLLTMTSFISAAAFVFSTTAKNTFESLIFLLLLHPFDVGDRVFINLTTHFPSTGQTIPNTMSGSDALDNLVVVEMHLLSTVFERWDGVRCYVPNYVLATKPVFNIRRSGPIIEMQRIQISYATPLSKLDELRTRLDQYVRSDTSADLTEFSRVNLDAFESCNKIHVNLMVQYSGNWQDIDKQLALKNRFLTWVKGQLDELQIGYLPPVQRISIVGPKGDDALMGVLSS
jgi:small-conductance mechanosensitive channel